MSEQIGLPTEVKNILGGSSIVTAELGIVAEKAGMQMIVVRGSTDGRVGWLGSMTDFDTDNDGMVVGDGVLKLAGRITVEDGKQVLRLKKPGRRGFPAATCRVSGFPGNFVSDIAILEDGRVFMDVDEDGWFNKLAQQLGITVDWECR